MAFRIFSDFTAFSPLHIEIHILEERFLATGCGQERDH